MGENALRDGLCEDCGDDIALTDVQGHYDGKCAKCREYRVYETDHIGTGKSFEVYDNERKKKESGFKHG